MANGIGPKAAQGSYAKAKSIEKGRPSLQGLSELSGGRTRSGCSRDGYGGRREGGQGIADPVPAAAAAAFGISAGEQRDGKRRRCHRPFGGGAGDGAVPGAVSRTPDGQRHGVLRPGTV